MNTINSIILYVYRFVFDVVVILYFVQLSSGGFSPVQNQYCQT